MVPSDHPTEDQDFEVFEVRIGPLRKTLWIRPSMGAAVVKQQTEYDVGSQHIRHFDAPFLTLPKQAWLSIGQAMGWLGDDQLTERGGRL
jgi:hypothetical protein